MSTRSVIGPERQVVTSVRFGDVTTIQVYLFQRSHPADAHRLTVGTERESGLSGP